MSDPTVVTLAPEDTLATVADKLEAADEARRRAQFDAAKGTIAKLAVLGVISYDDGYGEMCRAFAWTALCERAKNAGRTVQEQEALETARDRLYTAREFLGSIVEDGETHQEQAARREGILAQAKGTMDNGRPCKHKATKKERGWMHQWGYAANAYVDINGIVQTEPARLAGMLCCRCGAFVSDEALVFAGPATAQAVYALAILAAAGLAPFDVVLDDYTTAQRYGYTAAQVRKAVCEEFGGHPSVHPAAV